MCVPGCGMEVLGLDIGGANLKAADSRGNGRTVPFALWKNPQGLTAALRALIASMPPHDLLAITMTGELCDCFTSKQEGVATILAGVRDAAGRTPVRVWTTYGRFITLEEAAHETLRVAAANWLAAATLAGTYAADGRGLFLDIGSTTTDIVELWNHRPVATGWTDVERLRLGELIYTGARRTPVCALLGFQVAAELFATTLDVYLALGLSAEDEEDCNTADGRPATKSCAHLRLARMLGGDGDSVSEVQTLQLAHEASERQTAYLVGAARRIMERMAESPQSLVISGSGEFLARKVAARLNVPTVSLAESLGCHLSEAVCAYAVACLAKEQSPQ